MDLTTIVTFIHGATGLTPYPLVATETAGVPHITYQRTGITVEDKDGRTTATYLVQVVASTYSDAITLLSALYLAAASQDVEIEDGGDSFTEGYYISSASITLNV